METRSSVIDGGVVEPVSELRRPRRKYVDLTREWVEANNMGHMWKEDPVYGYDLGPELLGSFYSTRYDAGIAN
jgi:hypothetical protein